ncbi:MAG: transcription-repair coupling factor [Candidatus Coproplasma sp.]
MKRGFFTPQNLKGEYIAIDQSIRLGEPTAVFGVADSEKYLVASVCNRPVLYICADPVSASKAYSAISVLSGKNCAYLTAKDDVLLYKSAVSKDALFKRIEGVCGVLGGAEIIVCDVESALQPVADKLPAIAFKKGEDYDYTALPSLLTGMGYTREYSVESKGVFAVRGDIIDIFPVGAENPVRVDFFGDTVERIRPYDIVSGDRLPDIENITILPAIDCYIEEGECAELVNTLKKCLKECKTEAQFKRSSALLEEITQKLEGGFPFAGQDFLFPVLKCYRSLFDILAPNTLIIFDECKSINDILQSLEKEHNERYKELLCGGEVFSFSQKGLISEEDFKRGTSAYLNMALQTFTTQIPFFQPLKTYNLHTVPSHSYLNNVPLLAQDIKNWLSGGYRVLIFADGVNHYERLCEALHDEYIGVSPLPDTLDALIDVCVSSQPLAKGFILHESKLAVVGSGDVFTKSVQKRIRKRRGDMFTAPEVGDYAVHEKHGVGRIIGTKKIETTDGIKEYVAIEYRGGDVLYVPVEQMDVLSKYVGEDNPTLSKIGGAEFERVKERVRQSVRKLAFDLKLLYAERSEKKGFCFPENSAMMEEFESSFEYEETPDQLACIEEIKADMCSDKVMDRLLCGDVGYGKTEVALRAVYLCVLGGKQSALMCPSTILSEQHYNTAVKRFEDFGVRVEKLNRFQTQKEREDTLKRLREGKIDFIIGTHRLLSNDVQFHDLGLLVLDEEQRFGVEHKEKIKHVKNDVDCLTMTATPIPRTLHMSLSGIRSISTINTAPGRRLPVQTYVVEESETLLRDALIREISRGGQAFVLYNRVESIAEFTARLCRLVPEAKVTYAHGRMDKNTLENNVFSFYQGEKNVLVTTTIIENGIDLPNANTIIVIDADRLGISQLYQLRGRVGRGSRLASAYFTFKPEKVMTSDATERLKAIMQFTELGSGIKIAMRDLEIRGAGNVLGAEQHGHMDKVGYELYSKILKEEITGERQFSAELDIHVGAYIPENYIESSAGRMDCYKQIAEIRSVEDYKRVCRSIEENYGAMPDEVLHLLIIAVLKSYASKFNVKKITVDAQGGYLELPSVNSLQDERLAFALDRFKKEVTLSMAKAPLLVFAPQSSQTKTMLGMTKFLKFAVSFTQNT